MRGYLFPDQSGKHSLPLYCLNIFHTDEEKKPFLLLRRDRWDLFLLRRQMGISRLIGTRDHRYKSLMAALFSFLPSSSPIRRPRCRLSRSSHINGSPLPLLLFSLSLPPPNYPNAPRRPSSSSSSASAAAGSSKKIFVCSPFPLFPPLAPVPRISLSPLSFTLKPTFYWFPPTRLLPFFLPPPPAGFVWSARFSLQSRGGGQIAAEAEAP